MKQISRKLLVVLLCAGIVMSLCAVSVFGGQQADSIGMITSDHARLRSGSDIISSVHTTLPKGTCVSVLGKTGSWYRVNYDSVTGFIGENCLSCSDHAEDLNTTGLVVSESAVLRTAASITAKRITSIARSTKLVVTGFENGWYQVSLDDIVGYIRSDQLTLNGKPAEESVDPVSVEAAPADDAKAAEKKPLTGKLNADDVNLRTSPDINADIITATKKGGSVTILETLSGWYRVSYDIHEGYISAQFVTPDDPAAVKTTAKTAKADSAASETSVIALGVVKGSDVRLRKKNNTDSDVLLTMSKGTAVSVLAQDGAWYKVNYNDKTGFIHGDYLDVSTEKSGLSTYALIQADVLNLRSSPGVDSSKVAAIYGGEYLNITGFKGGWFSATYDDYSGYVSGDFITLVNSKPEPKVHSTENGGSDWSLPSGRSFSGGSGSSSDIVNYAMQFYGVSYVYGGASPSGFDCSGFVMYVYDHFGYSMPHGATPQLAYGSEISQSQLQPGDLVFFHNSGDPDPASHVGIYIGDREFIHASSGDAYSVTVSSLDSNYYSSHYIAARHLL